MKPGKRCICFFTSAVFSEETMKKILILTDGKTGKHFVERVADTYTSENIYYVVSTAKLDIPHAKPSQFKFYEFDSTSFHKLANLLKMEFVQQGGIQISNGNVGVVKQFQSLTESFD